MLVPFVPVSSANSQTRLVSFLAAELRSRAVREDVVVHHAAGSDRRRPRAGEQQHRAHRRDLDRRSRSSTSRVRRSSRAACSSSRWATRSCTCGRSTPRAAATARTRCSSSSSSTRRATARSAARRCRTASTRCWAEVVGHHVHGVGRRADAGAPAPASVTTTTTTTTPGGTATTDAGHDRADDHDGPAGGRERAGAAQPGGGQARPGPDGARGGQARRVPGARRRRPHPGEAGPAEAAPASSHAVRALSGPGWGSAPGLLLWA